MLATTKHREYAINHFLAVSLLLFYYFFFDHLGLFPNVLFTLKALIVVDSIFGVLFFFNVFGKKLDLFYAISAMIEASVWMIYPLSDNLSAHSLMCYMGGVIILCLHLQLTKVRYVYIYFITILAAVLYIGDLRVGTMVLGHVLIACFLTIEIIRFKTASERISKENEVLRAKLHNKNYFSHHLFNPLTIIKGMLIQEGIPREKAKDSIKNCLDRMNNVMSQYDYSEEHIVSRNNIEWTEKKKFESMTSSVGISILIISILYATNFTFKTLSDGFHYNVIPSILIIILSGLFYFFIDIEKSQKKVLSKLVYFLVLYQILMGIEFYYTSSDNIALGVFLAGLIFSQSISFIDKKKVTILISLSAFAISFVIKDFYYTIMFVAFILYYAKVVIGSKMISQKFEEEIALNERMRAVYDEYRTKADQIIPTFNELDKELRHYLENMDDSNDLEKSVIHDRIEELILKVRED